MISDFINTYKRLLNATNYRHKRYLYHEFNLSNRLTGLIGPRGSGKTTLLLQYIKAQIKNLDEVIYLSIDHLYFSENSLIDLIQTLYEDYGVRYCFLDEVHKYSGWDQALKNLYDSYPDLTIVFSGSSSMDLVKSSYDLSRRAVMFKLKGMSFREYLLFNEVAEIPSVSYREIIEERSEVEKKLAGIKKLKGHFKAYLNSGYYPFYLEDSDSYRQKIVRIVEKIIYEDISNFYSLKTASLSNLKRIIAYLSTIPPGKVNVNNLSKHIGVDNKTIQNYLTILAESGLVQLLSSEKSGGALLKKTEKIYLDNPNLYSAIAEEVGHSAQLGTVREIFFINMMRGAGENIFYSNTGDFIVGDTVFEVGGKGKDKKQISKKLESSYLVKDDILYGSKYEIPLYLFGFLY